MILPPCGDSPARAYTPPMDDQDNLINVCTNPLIEEDTHEIIVEKLFGEVDRKPSHIRSKISGLL